MALYKYCIIMPQTSQISWETIAQACRANMLHVAVSCIIVLDRRNEVILF